MNGIQGASFSELSDEALIALLPEQQQVLSVLICRYQSLANRMASRFTANPADAEDLQIIGPSEGTFRRLRCEQTDPERIRQDDGAVVQNDAFAVTHGNQINTSVNAVIDFPVQYKS